MKKLTAAIILGIVMTLTLTGCGKGGSDSGVQTQETQDDKEQTDKEQDDKSDSQDNKNNSSSSDKKNEASNSDKLSESQEGSDKRDMAYKDGIYTSGDAELTITSKGSDYIIGFVIFRTCNMDDLTGTIVDGRIQVSGKDPSDDPFKAVIYEDNNGLVFEITETTWTYFETGTKYIF